ncbi:transglycosylase SLT domain-containing protein [Aeromonas sp.]|uniref:transglycosylase SLT domain-containing protein n=1 Tax=Aeromonas sp. TaxID=647 RepID=UPI00258DC151|nr:transglycosylase SLT domain-containing protein [Aeromonas sp.]MCX7132268.1 transglycosylase SLT domain-containing protein [Aeromonas sp.]
MIIQELAYKVTLQADEFLNGKRKVTRGVEDLDKETKTPLARIKKGFGEAADSASDFGEQGKNAFTKVHSGLAQFLGVAITLEAFRRGFLSTTKTLVDLGNTSSFLDMGTKSLEGFNRAAAATGSSEQSMTSMLMRLKNAKNWQAFPMGAPDATTIATQQLQGMTGIDIMGGKDPGDMLLKTAAALRKLNKQQAQVMWGNMGGQSDMFNLMYSEPMDKLVSKYTKGSNATDAAVKQARDVNRVLQDLNQTVSNLGNDMVLAFGPTVNEGLKQFSDWIANNKDDILGFFKEGAEWAKKFSDAVGGPTNAAILLLGMKGGKTTALAAMALIAGKTLADPDKAHEVGESLQTGANVMNGVLGLDDPVEQVRRLRTTDLSVPENMETMLDAVALWEGRGKGRPNAVSPVGAAGLYQLMPETAREDRDGPGGADFALRVDDEVDERFDNEKARAKAQIILARLWKKYGRADDVATAYHSGEGNVDKWIEGGRKGLGPTALGPNGSEYAAGVASYYGEQLKLAERSRPQGMPGGNTDNSQTSSINIQKVEVHSNPQTAGQLQADIEANARRGRMTITLASGNR